MNNESDSGGCCSGFFAGCLVGFVLAVPFLILAAWVLVLVVPA